MNSEEKGVFTDIHTHLFPSVDDGAQNIETTLELARIAWESGTGKLFLTPHFSSRFPKRSLEWYQERFPSVRDAVRERFPQLELYLGSEYTGPHVKTTSAKIIVNRYSDFGCA